MFVGFDNIFSFGFLLFNSFILYIIIIVFVLFSILLNWVKNLFFVLKGEYFSMIFIFNFCCRRKRREKVNKICFLSLLFIYYMLYIYLIYSKYFKIIYKKFVFIKKIFCFFICSYFFFGFCICYKYIFCICFKGWNRDNNL